MKKIGSLITCYLLLVTCLIYADGSTDALPYLRMGIGARASGLGNAFTGLADDGSAVYWNPAGLSKLKKFEVSSMYGLLSLERNLNFVSASYSISDKAGAVGLGIINAGVSSIKGYDENNLPTAGFDYQSFTAILSYGKNLAENVSLGANIKFISDKLKDSSSSGEGLDVGFLVSPVNKLSLGLMFQDIYTALALSSGEKDIVPMSSRAGVSYKLLDDKLTISTELDKTTDREKLTGRLGAEYTLDIVSLRLGLDGGSPAAGFSIKLWQMFLDYGFAADNFKEGDRHFVSLRASFGSGTSSPEKTDEKKAELKPEPQQAPAPEIAAPAAKEPPKPEISEQEKRDLMRKHYNRAVEYYKKKKIEKAISEWKEVLKLDPKHQPSIDMIERAEEENK